MQICRGPPWQICIPPPVQICIGGISSLRDNPVNAIIAAGFRLLLLVEPVQLNDQRGKVVLAAELASILGNSIAHDQVALALKRARVAANSANILSTHAP